VITVSSLVYVKRPALQQPARLGLGLRLVGVAGEYQRTHPPIHRLIFYTGPLQSSTNCIN